MKKCVRCKQELTNDVKTCPACGAKQPVMKPWMTAALLFALVLIGPIVAYFIYEINQPKPKEGKSFSSEEEMIAAVNGTYLHNDEMIIISDHKLNEYENVFKQSDDWDLIRKTADQIISLTFEKYFENEVSRPAFSSEVTIRYIPSDGHIQIGETPRYLIEQDGSLVEISEHKGYPDPFSYSTSYQKVSEDTSYPPKGLEKRFQEYKAWLKDIAENTTAYGEGKCSASESTIIQAAQQLYEENLKNPQSVIYNVARVEEYDDYQRVIVYLDASAQNSFGGYVRDNVYICLQYVNSYSFKYLGHYSSSSLSYLKSNNNWGKR